MALIWVRALAGAMPGPRASADAGGTGHDTIGSAANAPIPCPSTTPIPTHPTKADLPLVLLVDDEVRSRGTRCGARSTGLPHLCASSAESARAAQERHDRGHPVRPAHAGADRRGIPCRVRERWPEQCARRWRHALQRGVSQLEARPARRHHRAARPPRRPAGAGARDLRLRRIERTPGNPLDAVCAMAARVARFDLPVLVLGGRAPAGCSAARSTTPARADGLRAGELRRHSRHAARVGLFGHKARRLHRRLRDHVGLFQRADGGTRLSRRIGETSPAFRSSCCGCCRKASCARWARPLGAGRCAGDRRDASPARRRRARRALPRDLYYRWPA